MLDVCLILTARLLFSPYQPVLGLNAPSMALAPPTHVISVLPCFCGVVRVAAPPLVRRKDLDIEFLLQ